MRKRLFSIVLAIMTVITCMMFISCSDENKTTKYTINFDTMGGSEVASQQVKENRTIARPQDPTKSGYVFQYWYLEDNTVAFDFENYKVSENITLYAYWTDTCTITYKIGDEIVGTEEIGVNEYLTRPAKPSQDNCIFVYWHIEGVERAFEFETTKLNKNITLKAKFIIGDVEDGQIKFYLDVFANQQNVVDSDFVSLLTAEKGKVKLPKLHPRYDKFLGWVNATTGEKYLVEDYIGKEYEFDYDGKALLLYAIGEMAPSSGD